MKGEHQQHVVADAQLRRVDDGMQVDTPFGWKIRVQGKTVILVIAMIVIGFGLYTHDQRSEKVQQAMIESLQVVAYVLTLPEDQRTTLKLSMPTALRDRLLQEERDRRPR